MNNESYKIAYENVMVANKMLEKEIERLNENNQAMQEEMARTWKKLDEKENIIKEVREYIEKEYIYIQHKTYNKLLEILDKADKGE